MIQPRYPNSLIYCSMKIAMKFNGNIIFVRYFLNLFWEPPFKHKSTFGNNQRHKEYEIWNTPFKIKKIKNNMGPTNTVLL